MDKGADDGLALALDGGTPVASAGSYEAVRNPSWFPPQHGDIALIERCVDGGVPYGIAVCWHHEDQAWWNATGVAGPMPRQPEPKDFRELVIRHGSPVARRDAVAQPSAEAIARAFHETYERIAPHYGYKTRNESAVAWEDVPEPNKQVMVATVDTLIAAGVIL